MLSLSVFPHDHQERKSTIFLKRGFGYIQQSLQDEQDQWILWIPVALGIGIISYFSLTWEPTPLLGGGLVLFFGIYACTPYGHSDHRIFGRALIRFLFWVAMGFTVSQFRTASLETVFLTAPHRAKNLEATVQQVEFRPNAVRLTLKDVVFREESLQKLKGMIRITLRGRLARDGESLMPGQAVRISAMLMPPQGPVAPYAYDFRRHAFFDTIAAVGYASTCPKILQAATVTWQTQFDHWRHQLTALFRHHLPASAGAVAASLITGDRSGLSPLIRQNFADAGLAHILAISGLHLSIMAGLAFVGVRRTLSLVPRFALNWPIKKIAAMAALILTFGYLLISGVSIPAQRAFMMTGVMLVGVLTDRQALTMRNVALAAAVIFILRPESILSPSFQMSFAAVVALIAGYDIHRTYIKKDSAPGGLKAYIGGIVLSTVLATLATTPYILYTFNRVSLHAIPANLISIPLLSFILMPLLLVFMALSPFGLQDYVAPILAWFLQFFLGIAVEVASWPGSVILLPSLSPLSLGFCTLGALWIAFWKTSWRWLGGIGIAVSLLLMICRTPPDLYVFAKKKLIILADGQGRLWVNSLKAGRFAREVWQRQQGSSLHQPWDALLLEGKILSRASEGLVFHHPWGDVLIQERESDDTRPWSCQLTYMPRQQTISMKELQEKGGCNIWITTQGLVFHSVAEEGGHRPWTTPPE